MSDFEVTRLHAAAEGADLAVARRDGLRAAAFAGLIMLVVQYGLGIWVNLYANLPPSDHARGVLAAFGAAVAEGPPELAVHALLGLLLLVTAVSVVVRAVMVHQPSVTVAAVTGLIAILSADVFGARFMGTEDALASMAMAAATGVAIISYVVALFIVGHGSYSLRTYGS